MQVVAKRPVVMIMWVGTKPDLPSTILNSHMDVVPVFPNHWGYDPFEVHKKEMMTYMF